MLSSEMHLRSLQYAESNFLHNQARHLHVDKTFIKDHFDLTGKSILDFGCGMGGMTLWYAKNWNCRVHGLDLDRFHIEVAESLREKHHLYHATFEQRDILERPLIEKYDFIFLNDVAEHIPYPALSQILAQLANALAPGGRIFVSYPPWEGPYASHMTRVTHLPWCQYLPEPLLEAWIKRSNMELTGEHEPDLLSAWRGLNGLTHRRLAALAKHAGLKQETRLSHSILRRFPILNRINPAFFPLKFLISKEILVLRADPSILNENSASS